MTRRTVLITALHANNEVGPVEPISEISAAACYAGSVTLSPVLAAMGVPPEEGMGAVRFSLGRTTTWEELE